MELFKDRIDALPDEIDDLPNEIDDLYETAKKIFV
jgi:prefoldin subunit 5